jgi:hypothetical protein
MNEKQTSTTIRPTKKQTELLKFIETFIQEHGYSPSYREVMNGLHYTSVATVALHINSLIKRGHLRKRDHSARSLEVVQPSDTPLKVTSNEVTASEEKWLVEKIEHRLSQLEQSADNELGNGIDQVHVLLQALTVLGLDGAAQSFAGRLSELRKRQPETV